MPKVTKLEVSKARLKPKAALSKVIVHKGGRNKLRILGRRERAKWEEGKLGSLTSF